MNKPSKRDAAILNALNARYEKGQEVEADFRTLKALAQRIGICYRTVHRAAQANKIKTIRFGASRLIPRAEWERIMQRGF
jgi:excisionase family DNA binding protein